MRKDKITAVVLIVVMAMLSLTSCNTYDNFKETFFGNKTQADKVRIGVLEPLTGNDASKGKEEIIGIEIAAETFGQVLGKDVELIYADTQSSMYATETAVEDLIAKQPAIVLGSYGEAVTLTASSMLKEAKIPAISITATNPLITSNNDYYFRVAAADDMQGKALAQFVYEYMKQERATIVRISGEEATNAEVNSFTNRLAKRTQNSKCISTTIEVDPLATDYTDYAKELADAGNRAVFMPVPISVADKIFESLVEQNLFGALRFIAPKEWHTDELVELTKKYPSIKLAVASDLVVNNEEEQNVINEAFVEAYKNKTQSDTPSESAALAYDAYMIAIQAMQNALSIDSEAIVDALKNTTNFRGISGNISFDETGDPKKTTSIDTVIDGEFVTIFTVE